MRYAHHCEIVTERHRESEKYRKGGRREKHQRAVGGYPHPSPGERKREARKSGMCFRSTFLKLRNFEL